MHIAVARSSQVLEMFHCRLRFSNTQLSCVLLLRITKKDSMIVMIGMIASRLRMFMRIVLSLNFIQVKNIE